MVHHPELREHLYFLTLPKKVITFCNQFFKLENFHFCATISSFGVTQNKTGNLNEDYKLRPCKTGKFSLRPYRNDYGN